MLIKALSANRNVSTITSAQLVTVNNQPVTEQVTSTVGYLRAVANIVTGTTGVSETELQPGQLQTGFFMTLTPRILEDDRMLIRFSASLSSLIRINEQSSGSATIQIPEIDERAFLQEVVMRSGDSLVLSGFEQVVNHDNRRGLGHFNNFLLGSRKAQRDRTRIVITITPTLI